MYYKKEEIDKAKKLDLLTYLRNYNPEELVHISKETYCTKTHDSLRINNGMWYWFSQGFGGKSALDYLIKVEGYNFIQAVNKILNNKSIDFIPQYNNIKTKNKKLILPEKAENNNKIISYLTSRGIDRDIIDECIDNGIIYEQATNHNVIFVGYDENHEPRYAGSRGTTAKRFMQDVCGSDKTYSFRILSEKSADHIHLFESAIDLLSYATLMKLSKKPWYEEILISLAGVYQPAKKLEESKLPVALHHYLTNNNSIKRIIIHFDSDNAGRLAAEAIKTNLKNKYEVLYIPPPVGKDYNDYLCLKLNTRQSNNKDTRNNVSELS